MYSIEYYVVFFMNNQVGSSTTEFTLVDYPPMDDKLNEVLKSSGRLKQEVNNEQTSLFKF